MTAAGQDGYSDTVCVTYPSVVRVHVTEFRRRKSCTNCEAFNSYNTVPYSIALVILAQKEVAKTVSCDKVPLNVWPLRITHCELATVTTDMRTSTE